MIQLTVRRIASFISISTPTYPLSSIAYLFQFYLPFFILRFLDLLHSLSFSCPLSLSISPFLCHTLALSIFFLRSLLSFFLSIYLSLNLSLTVSYLFYYFLPPLESSESSSVSRGSRIRPQGPPCADINQTTYQERPQDFFQACRSGSDDGQVSCTADTCSTVQAKRRGRRSGGKERERRWSGQYGHFS